MASSRCVAGCNFCRQISPNTHVRIILSFGKVSKRVLHKSAFVAANTPKRGAGLGFAGDCNPADWTLHGPNPQRREARRLAGYAADQIRAGHQSQGRKALSITVPPKLL